MITNNANSPARSAGRSLFEQSIHTIAHRAGEVPAGWRPILHDALVALRAIECPKRAHIQLTSPRLADLNLYIGSTAPDPCVDGILRKLRVRTAGTCEVCGRPGILRCMGKTIQVLCAECAAPRLLQFWIKQFLRKMNDPTGSKPPTVYYYDQMPLHLRPLIPEHIWTEAEGSCKGAPLVTVSLFDILVLQRRFELIAHKLESICAVDDFQ